MFKKSGKCQGIYQENGQVREISGNSKLVFVKHVIAYLFMFNWFFGFKLITNYLNLSCVDAVIVLNTI